MGSVADLINGIIQYESRRTGDVVEGTNDIIQYGIHSDRAGRKDEYEAFYDRVSRQLGKELFGDLSFFLNLGYASNGTPERALVNLPKSFVNRNSAKLVLELIGEVPITGKRILDVGCGRGGTIAVLKRYFEPASMTGLDLSGEATAFNQRVHKGLGARFVQGDAECLPFESGEFDVALNIESSHSYPDIERFYSEVRRVLVPGGAFLYADLFSKPKLPSLLSSLEELGFALEYSRDITANVLLSCDKIASCRAAAFSQANDAAVLANFLARPGSAVYTEMEQGLTEFRVFNFRRVR